ncbi:hypothetical protein [Desulfonema magnum]|uniref:Uncharacterized protein n=1 Tax=Desulfonema magnum TaxID=45655 RepID=A0A975GSF3_9BACT|nr:hypothetical protein [Desulfonema magnum]QTA91018.1 Uncharacterized protein dnm_070820 [Desulfonema magnum]
MEQPAGWHYRIITKILEKTRPAKDIVQKPDSEVIIAQLQAERDKLQKQVLFLQDQLDNLSHQRQQEKLKLERVIHEIEELQKHLIRGGNKTD